MNQIEPAYEPNPTAMLSARNHKQTLVVELLGAAGSGKTTIARLLSRRHEEISLGVSTRFADCLPFFARDGHLLVPFLHREYWNSRLFRWYEARCMVRLSAWRRRLLRDERSEDRVVLLDHGPLFKLVRLREYGPEFVNSPVYQNWWERIYQQWVATLDLVVWLDAPDDVLVERIRGRSTDHRMKEKSPDEAFEFLSHYRACYQRIVDQCEAQRKPAVLYCDTHSESLDQTVDRILNRLTTARRADQPRANVA